MFVTQRMFILFLPFFLATVLTITCLKFLNIRIEKMTLISFVHVKIRNMAQSMERLIEKMQNIKIKDDIFLGNDFSFEQKFLNHVVNKCSKETENCEVSFYFSKKSMTICCETSIMTETIAKSLLDIVDLIIKQHFFVLMV